LHRLEQQYGSVIRGAIKQRRASGGQRPSLCNFRQGMAALVDALQSKLGQSACRKTQIVALRRMPAANPPGFEVSYRLPGSQQSQHVRAAILATPTDVTARLLEEIEPAFGELLGKIEYAGVAQVSAGYGLEQINFRNSEGALEGFGFLVPRTEGLHLLGTVWNSALFPERAPHGEASFTSFLGGATDPEMLSSTPEEIATTANSELASVLGITGKPATQHISLWQRALPQCNIGHEAILSALGELRTRIPGLFLTGNYFAGPSIGACIEHANRVAREVAQFVSPAEHAGN
jgi:oxygen-dependent protoporphyrinogen oxidase